jgi:hypothetical protein
MIRAVTTVVAIVAMVACQPGKPPKGERTGSPYSTGDDTGAANQRIEGTHTGVQLEAPNRIPGVLAALQGVKGQPDKRNLTALRGNLGDLEDAMANDLVRAGLADTGQFHALRDSLAKDFGGGPGSLAQDAKPGLVERVDARVRRLIDVYQGMMEAAGKGA